jgi:hypothetical protein
MAGSACKCPIAEFDEPGLDFSGSPPKEGNGSWYIPRDSRYI